MQWQNQLTSYDNLKVRDAASKAIAGRHDKKVRHESDQDHKMSSEGKALSTEGWWETSQLFSRVVYWGLHVSCLSVLFVDASLGLGLLMLVMTFTRLLGITAAYHRYFSHRTFKTGRTFQCVLAVMGTLTTQKGPLWWTSHHRLHHQHTDDEFDVHSPGRGFWYAHQGWIFDPRWRDTKVEVVKDLLVYPELLWLNRFHFIPPFLLGVGCYIVGGFPGLIWGFVLPTVAVWHLTYCVNSVAHIFGSRDFETNDTSRNNPLLGLLMLGEGWHNNHHRFPGSARQGLLWWQIDMTYYLLLLLQKAGIIWDLRYANKNPGARGTNRQMSVI